MSESKVGIKETKEIVSALGAVLSGGFKAYEDGDWDGFGGEAGNFMPAFFQLGPALEGFKDSMLEVKDLDPAEREELKTTFAQSLDFDATVMPAHLSTDLEEVQEEWFNLLLDAAALVERTGNVIKETKAYFKAFDNPGEEDTEPVDDENQLD